MNMDNTRLIACPRCGYDQRGVIESWMEACPLLGVCSECGLKMVWSEVIRPDKYEPRWCVEFRSAGWIVRSAWRTLLLSFRPWRFWHELKMSHEIRWRRIGVYLALLLLPFVLLYVAEQTAFAIRVWQYVVNDTARQQQQAAAALPQFQKIVADAEATGHLDEESLAANRANLALLRMAATTPAIVNHPLWMAVVEAVLTPVSPISRGTISSPWGVQPYPPPVQIHAYVFNRTSATIGLRSRRLQVRHLTRPLPFVLPMWVGIPLGFLLLPISRHRARVRWRHIGRVTAYSMFLPVATTLVVGVLVTLALLTPRLERVGWGLSAVLINYAVGLALLAWWAIAIRRYLKMPHGWLIAPLMAMITVLIVVGVLFYTGSRLVLR